MMGKKKILVVDDEQHVRQLIGKVLEKEGYEVLTACNGEEGLEIFQKNNIDLIISDIKMPKMNGIEFLHKVKEQEPGVGFILITAFATMETAIDAIKSGAQDYVTKPFDIKEILNAVKKILISSEHEDNNTTYRLGDPEETKTTSNSPAMQQVLQLARKVSASDATVLILGETGTGKEVISTAIHNWSRRSDKPMIKVNCGAIPDNLLESELFGYEKGAFTGADRKGRPGKFELADHGTIFLDEIGDMPLHMQVKILRVLQNRTVERIGGTSSLDIDVRIIAATNKDLEEMIARSEFREDLYFRLNVIPLHIPSLRERTEDIGYMLDSALRKFNAIVGKSVEGFSDESLKILNDYGWPGNVRELENVVEYAVNMENGSAIQKENLPERLRMKAGVSYYPGGGTLKEQTAHAQKLIIEDALKKSGPGREGKRKASERLGISESSLYRKMQELGLKN